MKKILKMLGIAAGLISTVGMFLLPAVNSEGKVEKVEIIHKPGERAEKIKMVPEAALKGHLRHGDDRGKTR